MKKYSTPTIVIHWISVILIATMVVSGKYHEELRGTSFNAIKIHGIVGFIVSLLTITRVILHIKTSRPASLKTKSLLRDKAIIWVQYLFYIVILILSLTGVLMMVKGGYLNAILHNDLAFRLDEEVCHGIHIHQAMVKIFIALFIAHVMGVISYIFKFKQNIFNRIF